MEVAVINHEYCAYDHAVRNADMRTSICVSTASPKWSACTHIHSKATPCERCSRGNSHREPNHARAPARHIKAAPLSHPPLFTNSTSLILYQKVDCPRTCLFPENQNPKHRFYVHSSKVQKNEFRCRHVSPMWKPKRCSRLNITRLALLGSCAVDVKSAEWSIYSFLHIPRKTGHQNCDLQLSMVLSVRPSKDFGNLLMFAQKTAEDTKHNEYVV